VTAEPNLWPALTGAETLEFLARVRGGADAAYRDLLVERFQLETSKKVRALSHGNRQKVQLIAAFASRAELLILDEPTGGLDPLMEMAFRETVREAKQRGQTVFLSSHIPQRGGGGLRSLERIGLPFPLVAPEFAQPREGHIGVSAS
jgi:ABC-2 type transport system ATP-binding protein